MLEIVGELLMLVVCLIAATVCAVAAGVGVLGLLYVALVKGAFQRRLRKR